MDTEHHIFFYVITSWKYEEAELTVTRQRLRRASIIEPCQCYAKNKTRCGELQCASSKLKVYALNAYTFNFEGAHYIVRRRTPQVWHAIATCV
jgi:hypothetical protein